MEKDESRGFNLNKLFRKKAVIGTNVVLMILVAITIFGIVSYINARHYMRFDFTAGGRFSISNKTENIIKGLDKPVTITVLFSSGEMFLDRILDILNEYKYQSEKISLVHIDPIRNPTRMRELAARIKAGNIQLNTIIFESGDRAKHVNQSEVIEKEFPFKFKGEEVFTSAILSVTEEDQTSIYITTGHGERGIDDYDRQGFSDIVTALKRDNFNVVPLDLLTRKKIPAGCDVLIIAGPTKSFNSEEQALIRDYVDNREGRLLVCLEPAFGPYDNTGLDTLLKEYNVNVRTDAVVYNKVQLPFFGLQTVAEIYVNKERYPEHRITQEMRSLNSVFFGACPVEAIPPNNQRKYQVKNLAMAADNSWGETEIGVKNKKPKFTQGKDIPGPIAIAATSEPVDTAAQASIAHGSLPKESEVKGARLVVFGDVDFAANEYSGNPGNHDIFLNSINWLTKKETKLGISAKPPDVRRAILDPQQMKLIYWLSVAGLPGLGLITGALVWWKRRR
ncbi:MAG: GldG family protein [Candidatus Brocadiales bacterium]|nr:GldG family protein [Candidatus Bathyanammoxibius sp.]MCQ4575498.1 GldG family protein [Candidatus Bathyanammoxibius amoris]